MPKKTEKGDLWDFSTSILSQNIKKMQAGPFGENFFFRKKASQCRKKIKGDPLVSPGMVCYAEKQEKPFWFRSIGQIVQFGAIIFCRTFKNYFGQFVWIEKKQAQLPLRDGSEQTTSLREPRNNGFYGSAPKHPQLHGVRQKTLSSQNKSQKPISFRFFFRHFLNDQ